MTTPTTYTAAATINGALHILWSCDLIAGFPDHNVYTLTLPRFPHGGGREIRLPGPPLRSVISVDYSGRDGGTYALPRTAYHVIDNRLILRTEAWPRETANAQDAVWITYRTERGEMGDELRDPLGGY